MFATLLRACAAVCLLASFAAAQTQVVLTDDFRIRRTAPIEIAAEWIADEDGDGVVQVALDDVVVDFGGAALRGSPPDTPPDRYAGVGVVVTGKNVTLRNLRVSGFRVGVRAVAADGLVVEDVDVSDNFRQRLGSGPEREDASDWLYPHDNDDGQWARRYGAGLWIERCDDVTVRRCRARDGQNGLCLVRVRGARVYDNDFSFLSGWGVALWRTTDSVVTRNALDFCVRGYSHGVYNRGQDSAGILMFEQCSRNLIAENSATHGGDGLFGFAGREALGEAGLGLPAGSARRRGCNDNLIVGNDLSYAAAHGLEMTFSFGNRVIGNRLVANAICGIWGGYSRDMLVAGNELAGNGDAGYGLERGGVNVEHAAGVRVVSNRFRGNRCGVHFWWDPDEHFADVPWARANGTECRGNEVTGNRFEGDAVGLHLRAADDTRVDNNARVGVDRWIVAEDSTLGSGAPDPHWTWPRYEVLGETRPVGARAGLRGRENILMTEWGPWDHERPVAVRRIGAPGIDSWWLLGVESVASTSVEGAVEHDVEPDPAGGLALTVRPAAPGSVVPYTIVAATERGPLAVRGVAVDARWTVHAFAWETDPREDDSPWTGELPADAQRFEVAELAFVFGGGGPGDLAELAGRPAPGPDRFGIVAETDLALPAGEWTLRFRSDDGLRVRVDGALVHDDWTWHAPRSGEVHVALDLPRRVALRVEHFELDGHAELALRVERRTR